MKRMLLISLVALSLAGCATSVRYVNYTGQKFPPKDKYYFVTIYNAQPPSTVPVFNVIGRAEVSGLASNGISPESLLDQAKIIARKKGADAIINARTEMVEFGGVYAFSEHGGYYHHYHATEYVPYSDQRLTFKGDLIVFVPGVTKESQ